MSKPVPTQGFLDTHPPSLHQLVKTLTGFLQGSIWSFHRGYNQNHNPETLHPKPFSYRERSLDLMSIHDSPSKLSHLLLHFVCSNFPASFKHVPLMSWLLNPCSQVPVGDRVWSGESWARGPHICLQASA